MFCLIQIERDWLGLHNRDKRRKQKKQLRIALPWQGLFVSQKKYKVVFQVGDYQ
jgi:hypothetical protein